MTDVNAHVVEAGIEAPKIDNSWLSLLDDFDEDQELIYSYERELGVTLTLDQALYFLDNPEAELRFKRKRIRIDNCGSWANWYNPHTGKRTGYFFHCGVFRECSRCLEKRAEKELGWLKKAFLMGNINHLTKTVVDRQTISKMLRNIHKTEYVRYPQSNGTDLLLSNSELGLIGEKINITWIMGQDWKEIVCTPEGRNKSGTIHIPKSEEKPEKFSIITTQQFTTNAEQNIVNRIMDQVVTETNDMNPESAVEVEDCINERSRSAVESLREKGYMTSVFIKKLKVVHNQISWTEISLTEQKRQNSVLINSLNTKNLTSEILESQLITSGKTNCRPPDEKLQ